MKRKTFVGTLKAIRQESDQCIMEKLNASCKEFTNKCTVDADKLKLELYKELNSGSERVQTDCTTEREKPIIKDTFQLVPDSLKSLTMPRKQPATQCAYTVAKHETYKHCIINTSPKSKLCSKKIKHTVCTKEGEHVGPSTSNIKYSLDVDNDSGRLHEDRTDKCSANIPMVNGIEEEYTWAQECLLYLMEDEIEIEHEVIDADSSANKAAIDLHNEYINNIEPANF
ncbi:unnamed protein product [Mytilus coruscus]|uniref:Uncharacterized protein n=1 Tax=Mytilus coruscus TaxID=42192 RepID=A0A6J8DCA3_MYTCO|nr:unnamed protein product [Mytilus coruscus]